MIPRPLSLGVISLLLSGCLAAGASDDIRLQVIQACFFTDATQHPVLLELANNSKDRQKGLMGREALAENAGMLFSYDNERSPEQGFWMYKTLLPLDIAFMDNNGMIVNIRQMPPCTSSNSNDCPVYHSGTPYWHAVEMNAGYFSSRKIETGDRLIWSQPAPCSH